MTEREGDARRALVASCPTSQTTRSSTLFLVLLHIFLFFFFFPCRTRTGVQPRSRMITVGGLFGNWRSERMQRSSMVSDRVRCVLFGPSILYSILHDCSSRNHLERLKSLSVNVWLKLCGPTVPILSELDSRSRRSARGTPCSPCAILSPSFCCVKLGKGL